MGLDVAADASGNAYVTGVTEDRIDDVPGSGFPTTPGAFQTEQPDEPGSAFVTKIAPSDPGSRRPPADFDGDGKADLAVFRPASGTWFITKSAGGSIAGAFGVNGDIPIPGDYDGDGKTDLAVFRPATGTWFISNSAGGSIAGAFGVNGDIPIPADYDGDGKTDLAVFRPATGT